jgi:hypothetical protein
LALLAAALATHLTCGPLMLTTRWRGTRAVERCEGALAVVDFDRDGLAPAAREGFARLAEQGVADLERLLSARVASSTSARRVRFVVSRRVDMSRTFGRTVLLPLDRVRDRRAPYLHETVHALLSTPNRSTWLSEGLACYLESWVAEHVGGYDAHVFTRAGDRGIHAAARRYARAEAGRAVLPWVGEPGAPPRLFEDRTGVARPFYVLSHSFTKYLVDELGLDTVLGIAGDSDPEAALRRRTGRSSEEWRTAWLEVIGPRGRAAPATAPR